MPLKHVSNYWPFSGELFLFLTNQELARSWTFWTKSADCFTVTSQWSQITSLTPPFLFGRISKKTSKLRRTVLCVCVGGGGGGDSPVNSPHEEPVKRKMFQFDYVIMNETLSKLYIANGNQTWWWVDSTYVYISSALLLHSIIDDLAQNILWFHTAYLMVSYSIFHLTNNIYWHRATYHDDLILNSW